MRRHCTCAVLSIAAFAIACGEREPPAPAPPPAPVPTRPAPQPTPPRVAEPKPPPIAPGATATSTADEPTPPTPPEVGPFWTQHWFPTAIPDAKTIPADAFVGVNEQYLRALAVLAQATAALATTPATYSYSGAGPATATQRAFGSPQALRVAIQARDGEQTYQRAWGGVQTWVTAPRSPAQRPALLLRAHTPAAYDVLARGWLDVEVLANATASLVAAGPPSKIEDASGGTGTRFRLEWLPREGSALRLFVDPQRGGAPTEWTLILPSTPTIPERTLLRYRFEKWRRDSSGLWLPTAITRIDQPDSTAARTERLAWSGAGSDAAGATFAPPPGYAWATGQRWIDIRLPADLERRADILGRLGEGLKVAKGIGPGGVERWVVKRANAERLNPWPIRRDDAILGAGVVGSEAYEPIAAEESQPIERIAALLAQASAETPATLRLATPDNTIVDLVAWAPATDSSPEAAALDRRIEQANRYLALPLRRATAFAQAVGRAAATREP